MAVTGPTLLHISCHRGILTAYLWKLGSLRTIWIRDEMIGPNEVVLNRGWFWFPSPPGIWQCLETFLIGTTEGSIKSRDAAKYPAMHRTATFSISSTPHPHPSPHTYTRKIYPAQDVVEKPWSSVMDCKRNTAIAILIIQCKFTLTTGKEN